MLFVYPAVISDKVDRKYLPGIIKSMELFFLQKIVSDIATQEVNLVISRSRISGKYSEIRMESAYEPEDLGLDLKFLKEQTLDSYNLPIVKDLDAKIKELEHDVGKCKQFERVKASAIDGFKNDYDICIKNKTRNHSDCLFLKREISKLEEELYSERDIIKQMERKIDEYRRIMMQTRAKYEEEVEREKREKEAEKKRGVGMVGGAGSLKIDTTAALDLRPTSTTVKAFVEVRKPERMSVDPFPDVDIAEREIPISVKIVPIVAENFGDIYDAMMQDYFSNKFSAMFKSASRGIVSGLARYLSPVAKALFRLTRSKENVSVYKDIILNKQGIINSSTFQRGGRSKGKSRRYSSAIVVFSSDDIRNPHSRIFNDPNKLQHLYQLGWNSIGIADDKDQEFTFCTGVEGGMCTKIPYSHVYKSLQASDLYKDADQLSRFTSRVIGKFKKINFRNLTSEAAAVKMLTAQKVQTLFEKYGGKQ